MKDTFIPLAVASDRSESIAYSSQRLVNMYPEKSRFGGKSPFVLLGVPGLKPWANVGVGPYRGHVVMAGILYIVSGTTLYEVSEDGTTTSRGTVPGSGYVTMAKAGAQIAISIGATTGYIYDADGPVAVTPIVDGEFFGGESVTSLDGYFIWASGGAFPTRFQISGLLNGMDYDAFDFASVESSETELIRPYLCGSQILMMKSDRIEPWYNSGNADFPFERVSPTVISKGLAAKFSPAFVDNTVYWLGRDDEAGGTPIVYRLNGYTAEVVSTPDVARALAEIDKDDYDQIRGVSYVKDNHAYYGILLPTGNSWWCDVSMNHIWHERATHQQDRWLGNSLISAYGKTLVGSYANGAIYELNKDTYIDAGAIPLVTDVTLPTFGVGPNLKKCGRIWLDMEGGLGLITGQGEEPIVTMNISTDKGHTWSSDMQATIGKFSKYEWIVEWRRLGQFRDLTLRFRISDPIPRRIIACYGDFD